MLVSGFQCFIFLWCFAFNDVLPAHSQSFPSSAAGGESWKLEGMTSDDIGIWVIGRNSTVKILLSTRKGCSTSSMKAEYGYSVPPFGLGFFAYRDDTTLQMQPNVLGVFLGTNSSSDEPILVWSANSAHPVGDGASLNLTADGNLVLKDGDGRQVWSTNTSGHSVVFMNLTCEGNLVLVNDSGGLVWQSYDHPTDTLICGQTLPLGQRLSSRAFSTASFSQGNFYVLAAENSLNAFIDTDPPAEYSTTYIDLLSISCDYLSYLKLEQDGHLRKFGPDGYGALNVDVLQVQGGNCGYPTACGSYGVCFDDNSCGCPLDT